MTATWFKPTILPTNFNSNPQILSLYSITGCLCNNDIFRFSDSIIINSFYNLDFPSVLCCFIIFNIFHSKISCSFKTFSSIQKCYIHLKTYFLSKTLRIFIQYLFSLYIQSWKDSHVISWFQPTKIGKRRRMCLVAYILKLGTSWNELELFGTSWNKLGLPGMNWNHLEQGETTCNDIGSATNWHKKQETCRKKLCAQ